jgi:hypothetical protein
MDCGTSVEHRLGGNSGMKISSSIALAAMIAIAFVPSLASAQMIHACVSSGGAIIIRNTCTRQQTALTWAVNGAPGPKGDTGPQGPAGPAGSGTLSANTNVQSLNLVDASNHIIARLAAQPNGGGGLTFFDSNGNRFILVGVSDDGTQAGLTAYDGNTFASGSGVVRTRFGVAGSTDAIPGFGMNVFGADGTSRIGLGTSLDGTTVPAGMGFYDGMGKLTVGLGINSTIGAGIAVYDGNSILAGTGIPRNSWGVTNSGGGNLAGIGNTTFDANGIERTRWGDAIDDSLSDISFFDANGGLRAYVEYFPAFNFAGFETQDGSGHVLASLGSTLTGTGFLGANDSSMQLLDTSGQLRVIEFNNSANEGGVAFSPTNVFDGGWGNP